MPEKSLHSTFHVGSLIRNEKIFISGSEIRDEKMVGSGSGIKHPGYATLVCSEPKDYKKNLCMPIQ
jgi:hypothetical protein